MIFDENFLAILSPALLMVGKIIINGYFYINFWLVRIVMLICEDLPRPVHAHVIVAPIT